MISSRRATNRSDHFVNDPDAIHARNDESDGS
jgi:hypothetical protein